MEQFTLMIQMNTDSNLDCTIWIFFYHGCDRSSDCNVSGIGEPSLNYISKLCYTFNELQSYCLEP